MRFVRYLMLALTLLGVFVIPSNAAQHGAKKPSRDVWIEVFQGEGGYRFLVDSSRIETPCRHTRRCWVRVLNPTGGRLEALVEFIEAHQARTLGEIVYDATGTVRRNQTTSIAENGRSRPFQDIAPRTSNDAVWDFLFRSPKPKVPL